MPCPCAAGRTNARAHAREAILKAWPSGGYRLAQELDRRWLSWVSLAWVLVIFWFLYNRQANVHWLVLGDTDDNMRLAQVRALLGGQGWYDLRQYRLDPALGGYDIHWSRLVDLPIAALILLLKPFVGMAAAERVACGVAPLLPLGVTMAGIALAIRRLVAPFAWPLALIILVFACTSTILMYAPMRIDHHGWQLACLAVTVAGLADPARARGGAVIGVASAVSLTIGLELLPYCVMAGAIVALRWIWDGGEARRLQAYALTLSGGCALGFAVFASDANQAMRCDALTPVWLSTMLAAGGLLFVLSLVPARERWQRLVLAGVAGIAIAGAFAGLFPQCLGRPEGVSPELERTWLNNVREARPIYRHPFKTAFPIAVLPVIGLIGAIVATRRAQGTPAFAGWAAVTLFTWFSGAMLLWQIRAGPAAQMLSVPGATALAWIVVPWCLLHRSMVVRVLGSASAFLLISGLFAGLLLPWLPVDRQTPNSARVAKANAACARLSVLGTLDALPATTMFTHVDLGPRLITVTHHNGIAGPYHRNERAILDVHKAFTGPASGFRAIAARHGAQYLLVCPNMAETTVYRARNPAGFYAELHRGHIPAWLEPVKLRDGMPYRLWRIRYDLPDRPGVGGSMPARSPARPPN